MHVATYTCTQSKIRRPPSASPPPPSRKGVPPRSSNLNTFTAHESARSLARCSCRERQRRISAGGSLYRVYHVCACEYRTYKWKKDGPGRPSPAANPLIYRLRVSACIRRLGHMPLPPPPSSSFFRLSSRSPFFFFSCATLPPLSLSSPPSATLTRRISTLCSLAKIPRESLLYEFRGRWDTLVRESRLMAAHILSA